MDQDVFGHGGSGVGDVGVVDGEAGRVEPVHGRVHQSGVVGGDAILHVGVQQHPGDLGQQQHLVMCGGGDRLLVLIQPTPGLGIDVLPAGVSLQLFAP